MKGMLGHDHQYLVYEDKMQRVEYDLGLHKPEMATDHLNQKWD